MFEYPSMFDKKFLVSTYALFVTTKDIMQQAYIATPQRVDKNEDLPIVNEIIGRMKN